MDVCLLYCVSKCNPMDKQMPVLYILSIVKIAWKITKALAKSKIEDMEGNRDF